MSRFPAYFAVTLNESNDGVLLGLGLAFVNFLLLAADERSSASQHGKAILDCELVACGPDGMPCFRTLMAYRSDAPLCLWAFDLLALDGVRLLPLPLHDRKARLAELVAAADTEHIQFSGAFPDAQKLLATCERMDLEGIVSKRRDATYQPGRTRDWLKVKTVSWRATNRDRFALLHRGLSSAAPPF